MTGWAAVIAAALSLLSLFLEWWMKNSPQRKKEERDEAIQQGRQDIVDGDVNAVSARIDRLLSSEEVQSGSVAGKQDSDNKDG